MGNYLHPHSDEMRMLIKFLGLPENTRAFNLRARPDELVTVTCQFYPERNAALEIAKYFVCVRQPKLENLREDTVLGETSKHYSKV